MIVAQQARLDGLVQPCLQGFPGRQHGQVLGHVDAAAIQLQQFDLLLLLAGAEDDAQRQIFVSLLLVAGQPTQVELHLTLVLGLEPAQLKVDGHQALELAVVEQQVDVEILIIDLDASLACYEGETGAQFQQKLLDLAQDGILQVALQIAVVQAEKIQQVGIFEQ